MLGGGLDAPICNWLPTPTLGVPPAGLFIPAPLWRTRGPRPLGAGRQEWQGQPTAPGPDPGRLLQAVGPEAVSTPGVSAGVGSPRGPLGGFQLPPIGQSLFMFVFLFLVVSVSTGDRWAHVDGFSICYP